MTAPALDVRACPHCGGVIKAIAKLCRHCRRTVDAPGVPGVPVGSCVPVAVAPAPVLAPPPALLSPVLQELRTFVLGRKLVVAAQLDSILAAGGVSDAGVQLRHLAVVGLLTRAQADSAVAEFHQAQLARAKVFVDHAIARGLVPATHAAHAFATYADVALRVPVDEHLRDIGLLTPEQAVAMRGRAAKRDVQRKWAVYLVFLCGLCGLLAVGEPMVIHSTSALDAAIARRGQRGHDERVARKRHRDGELEKVAGREGWKVSNLIVSDLVRAIHAASKSLGGTVNDDTFREAIHDQLQALNPRLSISEVDATVQRVLPDVLDHEVQRWNSGASQQGAREVMFERTTVAWKLGLAWLLLPIAMGALAMRRPPLQAWQAAVALVGFGAAGLHLSLWRAIQHLPANSALQLVGIVALLGGGVVSVAAIVKPALRT